MLPKKVIEALAEAQVLLELCDPNGDRAAAFGDRVGEDAAVLALCQHYGFGAVMDSAARQWRLRDAVGAHTTGPAAASVRRGLEMIAAALEGSTGRC